MQIRNYSVVALISLTLIPLELTWTRIFSAEFFYAFAFLVLSLAILGLGLGALALRLIERLNNPRRLGLYLALAGLCALAGPIVVFKLGMDFSLVFASWAMRGKLVLTVLLLMSAYFFGGLALATVFKRNNRQIPRLYMADLLGAGAGVVIAILAMDKFGTPEATILIALPILLASLVVSAGFTRLVPIAIGVSVFILQPKAAGLLEMPREERAPVIYKHWDAMAKLKLYDYGPDARGINIDNVANSPVYHFDGNWDDAKPGETEWSINVSYLIRQFDSCTFLSLGSGGGSDVLQALVEGATEVHAAEINRHINDMMMHGDPDGYLPSAPDTAMVDSTGAPDTTGPAIVTLPEFSGRIYEDPRVTVATEDARAYVRRFHNKFDVIYSLSSNTWAALSSGAFALAENYLFTTEAFEDYWTALSDSGFLMMEHQVYMPRLVSEVKDALGARGVENPGDHFAVYDLPKMHRNIVLISKRPLTDSLRYYALGALTPEKFDRIHLLYPPANDSLADNLINRIVTNGWRAEADSAVVDISPVTDDRPFVAQLGLWRNLGGEKLDKVSPYAEFYGFPLSRLIIIIILAVVVVLILPLNLLPYLKKGPRLRTAPWLYFFCIGVAFMAVETVLIQKYGLLIGPSLYSIVTILLTLLVASGIGSRFARVIGDTTAFVMIVIWLLLDAFVFRHVMYAAGGLGLFPRMAITAALLFPLGFFMGMPFPKGALRVGELIDWGFAVNGAASVLGSILVLLVAFAWGFTTALTLAAVTYFAAFLLMRAKRAWV